MESALLYFFQLEVASSHPAFYALFALSGLRYGNITGATQFSLSILNLFFLFFITIFHSFLFAIAAVHVIFPACDRPRWLLYTARLVFCAYIIFNARLCMYARAQAFSIYMGHFLALAPPAACIIVIYPVVRAAAFQISHSSQLVYENEFLLALDAIITYFCCQRFSMLYG